MYYSQDKKKLILEVKAIAIEAIKGVSYLYSFF
jgi:hypothetical protein